MLGAKHAETLVADHFVALVPFVNVYHVEAARYKAIA
jgi:hypothetical protein